MLNMNAYALIDSDFESFFSQNGTFSQVQTTLTFYLIVRGQHHLAEM